MSEDLIHLLILILFVIAISFASAMLRKGGFSTNIFLSGVAIGSMVLIWIPLVGIYFVAVPIIIMIAMLISEGGDGSE